MTAVAVAGERLADFLCQPPDALTSVDVTSPPPSWAPLKPSLLRLVGSYRERGASPPAFSGVPLCLFGSEWPGFPSRARATPARGRCGSCLARHACAHEPEVPAELLPISEAPLLDRWRAYADAFRQTTGSGAAIACTPFVERIVAAFRGPVSIEPSVLLSDAIDPSARVVVFPHRVASGSAGEAERDDLLACVRSLLTTAGADPASELVYALRSLPLVAMPIGVDGTTGSWRLKVYLRLEERTFGEKEAVLAALARRAPNMDPVSPSDLQMLGLVLDGGGLHTVKAYVAARPSGRASAAFPPPLAAEHPLVRLAGDRALATLDVWCRGARRANKWDFNLRQHYLAGAAAEHLIAQLVTPQSAAAFRRLLVGPGYRADVVAIGVRGTTIAPYMELD